MHWVQVRSPPDLRRPPHGVELCADPQPRNPCRSVGFIRAGSDFTLRRPETEICADAEIATSAYRLRLRDGQWLPLRSRWLSIGHGGKFGHGGNIQPAYSHVEHGNSDALTTFQSQSGGGWWIIVYLSRLPHTRGGASRQDSKVRHCNLYVVGAVDHDGPGRRGRV